MPNKLVSIIIPTFNRADLIAETLNSIVNQIYTNWECLIIDDESTDETASLIAGYIDKDKRFQYHQRPIDRIKGANACRNFGFELSNGMYIKWFDSDDIMHPDFLEKQVGVLDKNKELGFCAAFSKIFTKTIHDANEDFIPQMIYDKNALFHFIIGELYFLTPSSLWRREVLNNKELFDETLSNAQETDFNFRRLTENVRFCYIEDVLFFVRRGHKSIDSEASTNPISLQSQFDYFQKVYKVLNSNECNIEEDKIKKLKKYILYRKLHFFYEIRLLVKFNKSIKNFKSILENLKNVKLSDYDTVRLYVGITVIILTKKGFRLIHLKRFDIRIKDK